MHFCDDRGCLSLFHHRCELDGAIVEYFDARCRASNPNRSNWGVNLHIAALSDAACNKVECPFSEADQSSIRVSMRVVDVFIQFHLSIVGTTEGCAICKYDTERTIDALVFTPTAGAPGSSTPTTFTLSDTSSAFATATVNSTTTVIDTDPAAAPTISGTVAGQTTISEAQVHPFSGVTIADPNSGATDTLTITLSNSANGTLSGTALINDGGGVYSLAAASPATISSELDALVFTPTAGAPGSSTPTTFTLSDTSSAFATATVNSTTTVIDTDPAAAPTISGTVAGQTTISEAQVHPFSGVTIADPNSGATDTLTITLSNSANGTLSGTALINDGGWDCDGDGGGQLHLFMGRGDWHWRDGAAGNLDDQWLCCA